MSANHTALSLAQGLLEALTSEMQLAVELTATLTAMRQDIERDALDGVDAAVERSGAQVADFQRRLAAREVLMRAIVGDVAPGDDADDRPVPTFAEVDQALSRDPRAAALLPSLGAAYTALRRIAEALDVELQQNRHVVFTAATQADAEVRARYGVSSPRGAGGSPYAAPNAPVRHFTRTG